MIIDYRTMHTLQYELNKKQVVYSINLHTAYEVKKPLCWVSEYRIFLSLTCVPLWRSALN